MGAARQGHPTRVPRTPVTSRDPTPDPALLQPPSLRKLMQANASIPASAVCTHPMATVRVDVPPGTKPHFEHPRRKPKHKHDAVTGQIKEWLDDGVIEKCPMASPWNMGLVVVAKATEPRAPLKYRVCIAPRPVN